MQQRMNDEKYFLYGNKHDELLKSERGNDNLSADFLSNELKAMSCVSLYDETKDDHLNNPRIECTK